jgi:hypothetical protein
MALVLHKTRPVAVKKPSWRFLVGVVAKAGDLPDALPVGAD